MGETITTNQKAFRDFALSDKMECGILLQGSEVKSVRNGKVAFKDTFARLEDGELYLYNLYIEPYAPASYMNEDPDRKRKLLMHKQELKRMIGKTAQKNVTLIPTKIYFNARGYLKVEIAIGKGKKSFDKRDDIKKQDIKRDLARRMHQR
jgi:SsrA-binding protein